MPNLLARPPVFLHDNLARIREPGAVQANWDDLKVVLAVSRTGSMTLAAEALGMDQSTCSRRLTALEAGLGAILFMRSKAGMSPTEAGDIVINRAIEVERRMLRMTEDLNRKEEGAAGVLRLVANPWVLEMLAGLALAPLLAAHPHLDLRLIPTHPRAAGRSDPTVSLWFEQAARDSEFAVRVADVPYAVYHSRDHDPAGLPWVSFLDEDSPRLAHIRALEGLRQRGDRVRMVAGDNRVLIAAIAAGHGKGLVPVCLAGGQAGLVRLGKGPPELVRTLHVHLHPDTVQTMRVQIVTRWLRECAAAVFGGAED